VTAALRAWSAPFPPNPPLPYAGDAILSLGVMNSYTQDFARVPLAHQAS